MIRDFKGKVALITGGSSGIGLGTARALAAAGANIALIGTHQAKLDAALATVSALGARALAVQFDVTVESRWEAMLDHVESRLGHIDLLMLNAGAITRSVPIEQTSLEEWRWIWDVNVNGVFYGLRAMLPRMKLRGAAAHIVLTSSIGALLPRVGAVPYGASKAAVVAMAEAVRMELAGGPIGISVLCPAGVRTSFNETARRNAPAAEDSTYDFMKSILDVGMDPLKVGEFTLRCISEGRFHIFTHPGFKALLEPHYARLLAAFADSAEPGSKSFGA